ncbi:Hypothetical protein I596_957 [Dokdonella koreensis DS-123]|uniref:Uncharacterized protein n=1 Tax=Dokdonella koreensis DS-123 TaxID=1300342 RepID=A0A160DRX9_9GAMM|nr:Hypothetical protein I596_957 [Dokdonella koreensis DS-123]
MRQGSPRIRAGGTAERSCGRAWSATGWVEAGAVNAGDRVVVRGAERLADGQRVSDRRAG